jgi:hypothetical protein
MDQGANVDAPIVEAVEGVDDTPLIPAQAIQFRHHQFVTINQGIERRVSWGRSFSTVLVLMASWKTTAHSAAFRAET